MNFIPSSCEKAYNLSYNIILYYCYLFRFIRLYAGLIGKADGMLIATLDYLAKPSRVDE